jgi:hypothetical protein
MAEICSPDAEMLGITPDNWLKKPDFEKFYLQYSMPYWSGKKNLALICILTLSMFSKIFSSLFY